MEEKEAIKRLIEWFEKLINAKEEDKEEIAGQIDQDCTMVISEDMDFEKWNQEFKDIVSNCYDLHHWNDEEYPPTYSEEDIKNAIKILKKLLQ